MRAYVAPTSIADLIAALATIDDPLIVAGGQSLLPAIRERGTRTGTMVDVGRIADLKAITIDERGATIGAGVVMADLMRGAVAERFPALAEAAGAVGNHVVRGRSTLGGCLGWANPRAEMPTIMLAHDAAIRTQHRTFPVSDLVTGPFTTCLSTGEVILSVHLPPPPPMVFDEVIPRNSTGRAIVSAACAAAPVGATRVTLAGLTDLPLDGWTIAKGTEATVAEIRDAISTLPLSDHFTSLDYRLKAAAVLIRRCRERLEILCARN